jgi:hypothetical protein
MWKGGQAESQKRLGRKAITSEPRKLGNFVGANLSQDARHELSAKNSPSGGDFRFGDDSLGTRCFRTAFPATRRGPGTASEDAEALLWELAGRTPVSGVL